jgi:aminoglycoside/choline kinase family phosphotransferase
MHETDARVALIREWLAHELRLPLARLEPASSDASFRRYFRAFAGATTYVVMDAPPGKEDVRPYLRVSGFLAGVGVHVPHVHEADAARGLLLLEDLGTTLYLERLQAGDDPARLYGEALAALVNIQVRGAGASLELPPYDEPALARELALMPEWFLRRHLLLRPDAADEALLTKSFTFLVVADRNPGVIDFQDALRGPVGYDLVSLLKDCYIAWPRERVVGWVAGYRAQLAAHGGPAGGSDGEFLRWFDLVGVQRHLKVLGIFCRLWYRDGKAGYLPDLPRTLDYVRDTCARYDELGSLARFLTERVAAALPLANARERA